MPRKVTRWRRKTARYVGAVEIPVEERRRRIRAAWAYSLMEQRDLADAAGIHYNRLRSIIGARGVRGVPTFEEMRDVARACNVPARFMEEGFGAGLEQRFVELEQRVAELERRPGGAR